MSLCPDWYSQIPKYEHSQPPHTGKLELNYPGRFRCPSTQFTVYGTLPYQGTIDSVTSLLSLQNSKIMLKFILPLYTPPSLDKYKIDFDFHDLLSSALIFITGLKDEIIGIQEQLLANVPGDLIVGVDTVDELNTLRIWATPKDGKSSGVFMTFTNDAFNVYPINWQSAVPLILIALTIAQTVMDKFIFDT